MSTERRASGLGGLIALSIGSLAGCGYSWEAELRHRASYQHDCPEREITIIADNGNRLTRQARLEVCGRTRVYEHVNTGATYEWRDVTSGDEAPAARNLQPADGSGAP